MAKISLKVKNENNIAGKPRVYFTSHPEDFDRYFERVAEDILALQDAAIYYTADMTEELSEENLELDLGRANLVVVPVTLKLLIEDNRAMRVDIPFAMERSIPVLPIMMESGIDIVYSRPDRFGERQYVSPVAKDTTALSYEKKLADFLGYALTSDETAKRVRAAFDAYIFLSYRKKDRMHANDLMRLIHSDPKYRDIAIWYDEFITLGESFRENISRALADSRLFALLVTPSLLEKPNFVMDEEYPAARRSGKDILPVEMVETDRGELASNYADIPDCVHADESLNERLTDMLCGIAIRENDDDPEHNYLIGLAYLNGIDVEVDRERGMELITSAAEAGCFEAMVRLYDVYDKAGDYKNELKWAERIYAYCLVEFGENHPDTLSSLNNLALAYDSSGNYEKALELIEKSYAISCKLLGEEHPDTLISLNNLALAYNSLGNYEKALELNEKVYAINCKVLGEEHPDTLTSLSNLAGAYSDIGNYHKALELNEKVYAMRCRVLGEEHPDTLNSLNNLALAYWSLGNYKKALELTKKDYTISCRVLGEEHPETLISLSNLASIYRSLGYYEKALELNEKAYAMRCRVLGEEHPHTLTSLNNLALEYKHSGNYEKAVELNEKVYATSFRVLGEEHPNTLTSLSNLASAHRSLGNYEKALELNERVYAIRCRMLGEEHPNTLTSLNNLADIYDCLGNHEKAVELNEKAYSISCSVLGEEHPDTLIILSNLAYKYLSLGNYDKTIELFEKAYFLSCKLFGKDHRRTINFKEMLDSLRG